MKKKIMLLLMATVLISSMIGCGNKVASNTVTANNQETSVEQIKEQVRRELEEEQKKAEEEKQKADEEKKALEEKIRKEIEEENKVDQEELKKQIKKELEAEQKSSQTSSAPAVVVVKETIPQSVYYSNSYIFPGSSNTYLSNSQVRALSNYELGIARNEIYARHGYIFQLQTFKSYFQSQSWYVPRTTNQNSISLNSVERSNVALIKAEEDRRGITW